MRLFTPLRLLAQALTPTTGVSVGAVYYDTSTTQPLYFDGSFWQSFGEVGFPEISTATTVRDNRQVIYFDRFQNDGVLTITGTGTLVGMR